MISGVPQKRDACVWGAPMETSITFNTVFIGLFLDAVIIWHSNYAIIVGPGKKGIEVCCFK